MSARLLSLCVLLLCCTTALVVAWLPRATTTAARWGGTRVQRTAVQQTTTDDDLFDMTTEADTAATGSTSSTSSISPSDQQELAYSKFLHLLEESSDLAPFDVIAASRDHAQLVYRLIGSDLQNVDMEENTMQTMQQMDEEVKPFPVTYLRALEFIKRVLHKMQTDSHLKKLYSAAKFIPKKEGLNALRTGPGTTVRQIVDAKRKIERSLSLLLILIIANKHRRSSLMDSEDIIFFSKILLERLPIHERHFALIVLCRGILNPIGAGDMRTADAATSADDTAGDNALFSSKSDSPKARFGRWEQGKDGAAEAFIQASVPPLGGAFTAALRAAGVTQPSAAARLLFPFAASALRHHHYHEIRRKQQIVGREEIVKVDELFEVVVDTTQATVSRKAFISADLKVAQLAAAVMHLDRQAVMENSLTDAADDALLTLRRWILDACAGHFIAMHDSPGSPGPQKAAAPAPPEHLRRNTLAMELISTSKALVLGQSRDRRAWDEALTEIGAHVESLCSLLDFDASGDEDVQTASEEADGSSVLMKMKKYLCCVSMLRYLPASRTRLRLLHMHESRAIEESSSSGSIMETRGDDEDLFGGSKLSGKTPNTAPRVKIAPSRMTGADDDLWLEKSPRSQLLAPQESLPTRGDRGVSPSLLIANVDRTIVTLMAEALLLRPEELLDNPSVVSEINYVFSTWRRPGLLLDYLNIHSSSKDVQSLYRRFLRSLFSISGETFDDIRYLDPGNKRHLARLPPSLATAWMEGRTADGAILPGYNDPQTLFMLGEDSSTCMMVRPRQKGTNRGLLSFLLHGNVRVLGRKDGSGRLLERCVVLLAIDDTTQRPVLYVETPFGEGDDMAELYDQCAELGSLLGLPVIYAATPDPDVYVMGDSEIEAIAGKRKYLSVNSEVDVLDGKQLGGGLKEEDEEGQEKEVMMGKEEEEETGNDGGIDSADGTDATKIAQPDEWGGGNDIIQGSFADEDDEPTLVLQPLKRPVPSHELLNISDYTVLAPWVWVDGVWDPARPRRYYSGMCPLLTRRAGRSDDAIRVGVRPVGSLELIAYKGPICTSGDTPEDAAFRDSLQALSASASRGRVPSRTVFPGTSTGLTPTKTRSDEGAKRSRPNVNANSMMAKQYDRNRALADRTGRQFFRPESARKNETNVPVRGVAGERVTTSLSEAEHLLQERKRQAQDSRSSVDDREAMQRGREKRVEEKDTSSRFAGEKDPVVLSIFDDDADDLFA